MAFAIHPPQWYDNLDIQVCAEMNNLQDGMVDDAGGGCLCQSIIQSEL